MGMNISRYGWPWLVLDAELKRLMDLVGTNPTLLARRSGVSRSQIYDYLHGKVPSPYPNTLQRLARGLATDHEAKVNDFKREAFEGALFIAAKEPPGVRTTIDADGRVAHISGKPDLTFKVNQWASQLAQLPPETQVILETAIDAILANSAPKQT